MLLSRPAKNSVLTPFIEAFWACEGNQPHELEQVLPHGRLQLLINLDRDALTQYGPDGRVHQQTWGAAVQGPALTPVVIDRAEQNSICGVVFSPGGVSPCLRVPVSEIGSDLVALDDLDWINGRLLRERLLCVNDPHARLDLLESVFLQTLPVTDTWDRIALEAAGFLAQGWLVDAVTRHFETTPQTLITRFRERTGMTPKTFSRIERFQRIVRTKPSSWADAAFEAGFADQPHMVREFRRFSGMTPSQYKAQFPKCMHGLLIAAARQARGDALPTMPMRWNHRR